VDPVVLDVAKALERLAQDVLELVLLLGRDLRHVVDDNDIVQVCDERTRRR